MNSNYIMMNKEIMHCQTNYNMKLALQFLDQILVLENHKAIHLEVL